MPNIKSAKKRLRQSRKRRDRNRDVRSSIRTLSRRLLATESKQDAEVLYRRVAAMLDRAACKNIVAPNAAARQKSRLSRHVNALDA